MFRLSRVILFFILISITNNVIDSNAQNNKEREIKENHSDCLPYELVILNRENKEIPAIKVHTEYYEPDINKIIKYELPSYMEDEFEENIREIRQNKRNLPEPPPEPE